MDTHLTSVPRSSKHRSARKTRKTRRTPARKRRGGSVAVTLMLYVLFWLFVFGSLFGIWFFLTKSGSELRFLAADTLITTQHRHWAKYLIGQQELDERVARYMAQFDTYSRVEDLNLVRLEEKPPAGEEKKELVKIEPISGKNFKGHLLIVSDPKSLRVAVPGKAGKGEKVSDMVKRLHAVAGVNGGGFDDPGWKGNGFKPTGVVMSGGQMFYNDAGMNTPVNIVGIDEDGRLVAGKYKPSELKGMGIREAVTFAPKFIVNGVGMIKNAKDGWGIAPRTCIGQKEDGTILFAIIDGRQPGHSIGATLYDVQNIFLEQGVVTAANLDGGSSTVLVHGDKIVNRPSSEYGERYLPTAWLVFDEPERADIRNIWAGMDPSKIDASKW